MSQLSTAFLDRDGTINVKAPEGEYIRTAAGFELLPGAGTAIRRLNAAGVRVIVVTNQRGVARGVMSAADLHGVHQQMVSELAASGAFVDAIYACTHERATCACRKPEPGLIHQALAADPDIDLARSAMVGDADSDIALGHAVGISTVRITGTATAVRPPAAGRGHAPMSDYEAPDLLGAVDWLLNRS